MYKILDESTITKYVQDVPSIMEYLGDSELEAREVGDGNLNHVWIIKGKNSGKSVVLKQALPYLRCVGEEYPLAKERMNYEIRSMLEYESLAPMFVPKIYHTNEPMCLMVMQNLDNHIIMRKGIIEGIRYPKFADHISDFLAISLFKTSSFYLDSATKRAKIAQYTSNRELCKLTEDFVFTEPYMEAKTNKYNPEIAEDVARIKADGVFKQKAMELKYLFMNKTDSLIHGDLHTGSIMLNQNETFVIDSEFAFYGPLGFDVGAVFGNLLMAYCSYAVRKDKEYQKWLLDCAFEALEKFLAKFRMLWDESGESAMLTLGYFEQCGEEYYEAYKDSFMKQILKETIGFAGCKMMRRQMGIAHVLDIESIEDAKTRAVAERAVIKIAREFVVNYDRVENIGDVRGMAG